MAHNSIRRRIFILGKTSGENNCTANTLLGEDAFPEDPLESDVSLQPVSKISKSSPKFCVTNTPGIMHGNNPEKIQKILSKHLKSARQKYDTFVLNVRYPVRMSPEEASVIHTAKAIIGASALKSSTILVFTSGQHFWKQRQPQDSFHSYLEKQVNSRSLNANYKHEDTIGQLILDVNRKCVTFDNDADDDILQQQLDEFKNVMDSIILTRDSDKSKICSREVILICVALLILAIGLAIILTLFFLDKL